jgi:hypothetical protein
VERRTTVLLLRLRFDLVRGRGAGRESHLAEEVRLLAFRGAPDSAEWLPTEEAERLLDAEPAANIAPEQAVTFVQRVIDAHPTLQPAIDAEGRARGQALLEAHNRVRSAAHGRAAAWEVEPRLPGDVVGVFVLLPLGGPA